MRAIGLPELIVLGSFLLFIAVPATAAIVLMVKYLSRKNANASLSDATAECPRCRARIPNLGKFCPFCGQPTH